MKLKSVELRETLKQLASDTGAIIAKADNDKRNLSDDEKAAWNELRSKVDATKEEIEIEERKEAQVALEAELNEPAPRLISNVAPTVITNRKAFDENEALKNWFLHNTEYRNITADVAYRNAELGYNLNSKYLSVLPETRALLTSVADTPKAGYTVGKSFAAKLGEKIEFNFPLRSIVDYIQTTSGEIIEYPFVDDIANDAAAYGEGVTIDVDVEPVFSNVSVTAYKYVSKIVKMSAELIQDNRYNLTDRLADLLAQRIVRAQENAIVSTNAGSSAPQGLLAAAGSSGVAFDLQTGLTIDEFIDIVHSVNLAYRNGGSCAWLVNDTTAAAMRKLKNTAGDFYWQPSVQLGQPSLFLDYPVLVSNAMPSYTTATSGTKLVLFGDFKQYTLRELPIRVKRLDELYAANDLVGFCTIQRFDGRLTGSSAGLVSATITDSGT